MCISKDEWGEVDVLECEELSDVQNTVSLSYPRMIVFIYLVTELLIIAFL